MPGHDKPKKRPRYPVMPQGECRDASWILTACYPELEYAEGRLAMTIRVSDGSVLHKAFEHAWNVTADGEVVDSTLSMDPLPPDAVALGMVALAYEQTDIQGMPGVLRAAGEPAIRCAACTGRAQPARKLHECYGADVCGCWTCHGRETMERARAEIDHGRPTIATMRALYYGLLQRNERRARRTAPGAGNVRDVRAGAAAVATGPP